LLAFERLRQNTITGIMTTLGQRDLLTPEAFATLALARL
jgi:hypothetical protein